MDWPLEIAVKPPPTGVIRDEANFLPPGLGTKWAGAHHLVGVVTGVIT